ncbi:helix-turn-helix transcriptional regulator [Mycobacterium sp. CBMA293]|uniref:TetR/AcrR family transcriptional regulator n=1 Tax=unclassified Mycolicibacterium TaxID=2636767 RepID=UPI0012DEC641|nr:MULTISPECIES: TetR/AcrR family transcriptional regulator [unclassified Mycolicibacterium]MUL46114.1 helix-turn-helix transcriptional regulator [Mycolicibacterium sp. CBMA 360]MUL58837.1 helix-turn-helix transcriptional regulator [Mycolicibacterium sp. CBMA 335]MUL69231.1 helix-turn-helix transcriptional regulator [Mycolicibacterium sp. CBMA 311]MUL94195.1 helix-turn-helix transcriptional regulator [Mycolicibacterium sp. CBMA 230]MUM05210.1 TetR family transcriptional regulator [Mycolicibact
MRLFSEQGYKATSITQIEKAAGLVPGCGALYNHFKTKDALLTAGIDRQLDRRRAMRDISALFAGEGELRTELTLLGRYLLSVLNQESQFLQVAARTPTDQSDRLNDAYAALVDGLYTELSDWIRGCAPALESAEARRIAVVGVNALLGKQATRVVFHAPQADTPDEEFIADWTAMLAGWIEAAR